MAAITVTNTFTNGTAADATEVNQNFTDLVNGLGDGTKDITVSAVTANGAATFNGAVTLGNATGDDIVITGRVDSHFDPKTASTYDLGDATQLWRGFYGNDAFLDRGAVGSPSHTFHEDTDTGIWSGGANTLNISTGGTQAISISSAQLTQTHGPTTLGADTGDDTIITGRIAADMDPKTASTYDLGDATQLWQHIYSDNFRGSINAAGDPTYSFHADTDTGMFSPTGDTIAFSAGGTEIVRVSSSNVGIGTTSPNDGPLHLHNASAGTFVLTHYTNGTTGAATTDGSKVGCSNDGDLLLFNQEAARIEFSTSSALRGYFDVGFVVGSPTDGDKGAGTINASGVYDDGTLLTDYVFESYWRGSPIDEEHKDYKMHLLDEEISFTRERMHLSTMPGRDEWKKGKKSLGELVNGLWETVETQFLYITELHERIAKLEPQAQN